MLSFFYVVAQKRQKPKALLNIYLFLCFVGWYGSKKIDEFLSLEAKEISLVDGKWGGWIQRWVNVESQQMQSERIS